VELEVAEQLSNTLRTLKPSAPYAVSFPNHSSLEFWRDANPPRRVSIETSLEGDSEDRKTFNLQLSKKLAMPYLRSVFPEF